MSGTWNGSLSGSVVSNFTLVATIFFSLEGSLIEVGESLVLCLVRSVLLCVCQIRSLFAENVHQF